jgi:hypothetical protein
MLDRMKSSRTKREDARPNTGPCLEVPSSQRSPLPIIESKRLTHFKRGTGFLETVGLGRVYSEYSIHSLDFKPCCATMVIKRAGPNGGRPNAQHGIPLRDPILKQHPDPIVFLNNLIVVVLLYPHHVDESGCQTATRLVRKGYRSKGCSSCHQGAR